MRKMTEITHSHGQHCPWEISVSFKHMRFAVWV